MRGVLWGVLALGGLAVSAGCQSSTSAQAEPVCAPVAGEVPKAALPEVKRAVVFWDDSGSMKPFKAPLEELIRNLDASALPQAGIKQFRHVFVQDALADISPLHPLTFAGGWTNLPEVAKQVGESLSKPDGESVAILISDMIVSTPKELRAQQNATLCGVSVPSNPVAPSLLGACLGEGGKSHFPPDFFASTVRVLVGEEKFYITIFARDADTGRATVSAVQRLVPGAQSKDLWDFQVLQASVSSDRCRYSPREVQMMERQLPSQAQPPMCRFRMLTEQHTLRCAVALTKSPTQAIEVQKLDVTADRGESLLSADQSYVDLKLQASALSKGRSYTSYHGSVKLGIRADAESEWAAFTGKPEVTAAYLSLLQQVSGQALETSKQLSVAYDK